LLRSRIQTSEDNDVKDHQWREELRDACGHAKLQLVVNLAQIPSTIKDLQAFEVGDILYFNKPEYASAEIAGSRVFSADVGSVGNNTAIQIKEFVQIPTKKQ
jgi:flagellar motor switch protein FliM